MALTGLILVRHGESVGNVAREQAEVDRAEVIDIDQRDPDVPLSELGRMQAAAFGRRLAELSAGDQVGAAWASPYVRTVQTAQIALDTAALELPLHLDERLRDRELGILDRLTGTGIAARFPDEAQRRRYLGKMYYRPPGGESWADVALRLRTFLADLHRRGPDGTVLVVTHDAVILLLRYVLENLTEQQILDISSRQSVGNASITRLHRTSGETPWQLGEFDTAEHLERHGSRPTRHGADPDVHAR